MSIVVFLYEILTYSNTAMDIHTAILLWIFHIANTIIMMRPSHIQRINERTAVCRCVLQCVVVCPSHVCCHVSLCVAVCCCIRFMSIGVLLHEILTYSNTTMDIHIAILLWIFHIAILP